MFCLDLATLFAPSGLVSSINVDEKCTKKRMHTLGARTEQKHVKAQDLTRSSLMRTK